MQAPGCTSPGKDHADSALVVLMEDRKHAFGGMQGCVEGGAMMGQQLPQPGVGLPAPGSQRSAGIWDGEACSIVFRVKGGAPR